MVNKTSHMLPTNEGIKVPTENYYNNTQIDILQNNSTKVDESIVSFNNQTNFMYEAQIKESNKIKNKNNENKQKNMKIFSSSTIIFPKTSIQHKISKTTSSIKPESSNFNTQNLEFYLKENDESKGSKENNILKGNDERINHYGNLFKENKKNTTDKNNIINNFKSKMPFIINENKENLSNKDSFNKNDNNNQLDFNNDKYKFTSKVDSFKKENNNSNNKKYKSDINKQNVFNKQEDLKIYNGNNTDGKKENSNIGSDTKTDVNKGNDLNLIKSHSKQIIPTFRPSIPTSFPQLPSIPNSFPIPSIPSSFTMPSIPSSFPMPTSFPMPASFLSMDSLNSSPPFFGKKENNDNSQTRNDKQNNNKNKNSNSNNVKNDDKNSNDNKKNKNDNDNIKENKLNDNFLNEFTNYIYNKNYIDNFKNMVNQGKNPFSIEENTWMQNNSKEYEKLMKKSKEYLSNMPKESQEKMNEKMRTIMEEWMNNMPEDIKEKIKKNESEWMKKMPNNWPETMGYRSMPFMPIPIPIPIQFHPPFDAEEWAKIAKKFDNRQSQPNPQNNEIHIKEDTKILKPSARNIVAPKEIEDNKEPVQPKANLVTPDSKTLETKKVKSPEPKIISTKTPDTKTPDAKTPDTKTPDTKTPDTKTPDTKNPEPKNPEPKNPEPKNISVKTIAPKMINETMPAKTLPEGADKIINTKILSPASIHGEGDGNPKTVEPNKGNIFEHIKERPVETVVLYLAPFVALSLFVMVMWIFKRKKSTGHKMNQMLRKLNEDDSINKNYKTKSITSQFYDEYGEKSLSDNGLLTDEQYFRIGNGEDIDDVRQDKKYKLNVAIHSKTSLNEESLSDSPTTLHDAKNNDLSFSIPIYNLGDDKEAYNNSDSKSMKTIYHEGFNELTNYNQDNNQKSRIKKSIKGIFNKKKSKDTNIYIKPQTSTVLDNQFGLPSVNITQFTGKDADDNNIRGIPPLPILPNKTYTSTHGTNNTEITMLNHNSTSNNGSPSNSNNSAKTIPFTAQSDQTMYDHNSNPRHKQRSNSNAIINLYDYSSRYETSKKIKIKKKSSKILINNELDSNKIYNSYNVW